MKQVYAFDFDGTLTTYDTLIAFIRYAKGFWALAMGLMRYAHLLVMMKLGCYPNWKVKQKVFAHFFKGLELDTFNRLCRDFAYDKHHLLRDKGIEAVEDALYNDIEVYIVSASIDNWVREFFSNELIHIIGTKIEVENGKLTGRFLTKNCYGQEKVNRLMEQLPNRQDYHLTAFGDSRGDKEMLAFADESYYKPFHIMRNPLKIFKIKPEERVQSMIALLVILTLNMLFISRLHELFMQPGFGPYWKAFEHEFHLSGYDPLTYRGVTNWDVVYQVYRHPLLAFMIWPLWLINEGLTWLMGVNCVQYLVAALLIFCSYYSYIFLYRIHREVIELTQWDATLLTAYGFSFAYILMSAIVPDHFTISMFLLLITLYISGICIKKGREFKWWQSAILFYITAGVTLSNGIKVFLSGFFVNLKDFFRPKYLLLAVILPAGLLWATATWEYRTYVLPKEKARAERKAQRAEQQKARVAQMTPEQKEQYEAKKARREIVLQRQAAKTGKPMKNYGFLKWTDISTSRWQTTYENLFGESIQFHQDYFLEDTLVHRPVFVKYRWSLSYIIEGLILILTTLGIFFGRKSRFLWLCLSCFAFDMFIHIVLGFGINEVYIMSPHYMFAFPITTAFLFRKQQARWLRIAVTVLTLYLFIYNGYLLTDFLLSPIKTVL